MTTASAARHPGFFQGLPRQPWFELAVRIGYVVRGLLYGLMGLFALGFALGYPIDPADQRGVMYAFVHQRWGFVLLLMAIVTLAAYSVWGFVRAIYDPFKRGDDTPGVAARIGFAWSGLNYAGLVIFATGFLLGLSRSNDRNWIPDMINAILSRPFGGVVISVAGAIGVIAGLAQFVDAYKATFRKDLKRNQMNEPERVTADVLGRIGMLARGVIFTMLGNFILQAGLHHDPSRSGGIGVAFADIAEQPLGHILLATVAGGFIALGLHSCANARWIRMPEPYSRKRRRR